MKKITGGPAFPGHSSVAGGANSGMYGGGFVASQGMTLRDYFAAKAMQGLLSNQLMGDASIHKSATEWLGDISVSAYEFADAMLRAREAS